MVNRIDGNKEKVVERIKTLSRTMRFVQTHAFRGDNRDIDQNFQKVLSDNNAVLKPVKLNDHHGLGVIDVFAKNLKKILSKDFLENKNIKCISILPDIIEH